LLFPALAWVAGLAAARCDFIAWPFAMAAAGLACICLIFLIVQRKTPALFAAMLLFLAGLLWASVSLLADARQVAVDSTWQHSRIVMSGEIKRIQNQRGHTRLTLANVKRDDGARLNGNIWLYVYAARKTTAGFRIGDTVRATARLHVPHNRNNPGGFDFESFCFDHHIALLGSASGRVQVLKQGTSWLEAMRQKIRNTLRAFPAAEGGVIRALLLAERDTIPNSVYTSFTATGAAHLLAISGLHIGIVAGFGFVLVWYLLTRREVWIITLPVRGIAMLSGTLLALAYATLAGWPLPTQRAVLMLAAAVLAWWLRTRTQPLNTLFAALMLILFLDATAITSLSLWLSFIATACILFWAGQRQTPAKKNRLLVWGQGLFLVTLIAGLATLPLIADVFGRLPVYGLPANLLMTPLYTLFVLPLSLLGALCSAFGLDASAHAVFSLATSAVHAGNQTMTTITGWPGGDIHLPELPLWLGAAYLCGMLLAVRAIARQHNYLAFAIMLITVTSYCLVASAEHPPKGTHFIAWDVGQGAASSLLLPDGKVLLVDAPGRAGSRFNGGTTVASGLRSLGLSHADVLIVSHAQSDHIGGMASLVQGLNHIGELWLADVPSVRTSPAVRALISHVLKHHGKLRWVKRGDVINFSGSSIRVLWPPQGLSVENVNNASLVISIQLANGRRLLLPGDIEAQTEAVLFDDGSEIDSRADLKKIMASDVLLIPHHGSRTSSTADFVHAVHPSVVIAQTGFANRYGFPNTKVVQRYQRAGGKIWNTSNGAVRVDFGADSSINTRNADTISSPKRKRALQWWQHFL